MSEKKYIVKNPLDLIKDRENGDDYGPFGYVNRINFDKFEAELELIGRFVNPCLKFYRGEIEEADITDAYNYERWGITRGRAKLELMKIFEPVSVDGDIIFLRYVSNSEFEDN